MVSTKRADNRGMKVELIYAIAEDLDVPNEWITVDSYNDGIIWFSVKGQIHYTCRTVRNGKYLKKNSIRVDR